MKRIKKTGFLNFDNQNEKSNAKRSPFRKKVHEVIFEAETFAGKIFDVTLLIMIFLSVLVLLLDTVPHLQAKFHAEFVIFEWIITVFFTIEFFFRLYCVNKPLKYVFSFFGIIDILSTAPMYINVFIPGINSLMTIRIFRLLRIFRIFKLKGFLNQANVITVALKDSLQKIAIFLFFVTLMVTVFGSILYVIENEHNPNFNSIPNSIYWAIVTITTVGYGDITPYTALGKMVASFIMILGYSVIAVPTGIVTSSFINTSRKIQTKSCTNCSAESHDADASYCNHCGYEL